jgi:hypothetical protein
MLRQASFDDAQQDVSEKGPDTSLAPAIGISNGLVISAILWACLYCLLAFVL